MGKITSAFFATIQQMEGGYQNFSSDTGNLNSCNQLAGTNIGIAAKSYEQYTKTKCATEVQMKGITPAFAIGFYEWFGRFYRLGEISNQQVFELCFNNTMGNPSWAAKSEQKALNRFGYRLTVDGKRGTKSIAALNHAAGQNPPAIFNAIREEWLNYLAGLGNQQFSKGWANRVNNHFPPMQDQEQYAAIKSSSGFEINDAGHILLGAMAGDWHDLAAVGGLMLALGLIYLAFRSLKHGRLG